MIYSHTKIFFIISILLFAYLSCTIKYYNTNKLHNDFTTEGFLDRDHYQVIIKGMPDKGLKGLVAERESALQNAKGAMNDKIINSLLNYLINYHINKLKIKTSDIRNPEDVKKNLAAGVQQFLAFGYTAFEYYNMDNSAVLVHRIFKDDLIEKIESIKPGIELVTAKEPEKK